MSNKQPRYVVGQTIVNTDLLESCMIIDVNSSYGFYKVKWFLRMESQIYDDRVSFFVAHKYFKPIEKVKQ